MKRCSQCHKPMYNWSSGATPTWCGCEPVRVWVPSDGETEEDARDYYTRDSEELASEIVKEDWEREPRDPSDIEAEVCIRGIQGGLETFIVTAEVNVDFSASLKSTEIEEIESEGL